MVDTNVGSGDARRVATGYTYDENSVAVITMPADLVEQRPDIVKAWIKTEIEAEIFIADPQNYMKSVEMVSKHYPGVNKKVLWFGCYGQLPPEQGGDTIKNVYPIIFGEEQRKRIQKVFEFLKEHKLINIDKLPQKAMDDTLTREVLKEMKLSSPVALIKGVPLSTYREN